jgi:hypothetical protein
MKTAREISTTGLLARVTVLASILFVSAAYADGPDKKLVLSVYSGTPGADSALTGNYAATIDKLGLRGVYFQRDAVAGSTNLCVAYIMTQKWDAARSACDEAVSRARATDPDNMFYSGSGHQAKVALAYSNRAVLNWLQNRPEKAVNDVTRAHSLAPRSDFVSQNWTVLNGKSESPGGPAIAAIQH